MTEEKIALQFVKNKKGQLLSKRTVWHFKERTLEEYWTNDIKDAQEFSKGFNPLNEKRKSIVSEFCVDSAFINVAWYADKRKKPKTEISLASEALIEFSKDLYLASNPLDFQNKRVNLQLTSNINEALLIPMEIQNILYNSFEELFVNSSYCYIYSRFGMSDLEPFNSMAYEQTKKGKMTWN